MSSVLGHRGPDDEGVYVNPPVALGHRRLAIIDLEAGNQPMSNASGNLWLIYNGEFYNFQEERQELKEKGITFQTRSDTEVLL